MKHIKYLIIVPILLFFGCKDVLNLQPLDKISQADVWNDESLIQGYINNLYGQLSICWGEGDVNVTGLSFTQTEDAWSDDVLASNPGWSGIFNALRGTITSSNSSPITPFQFGDIRAVNVAIQGITNSKALSEVRQKFFLAHCKFLRAYFYSQKVRNYGALPVMSVPLKVEDDPNLKRNTLEECYDFILNDLKEAIPDLDVTVVSSQIGYANKGAAICLKSRVELSAKRFAEAIKTCEAGMSLGYDLAPDYLKLFNNRDYYKSAEGQKEVFLPLQFAQGLRENYVELFLAPGSWWGIMTGWGAPMPSQDLVDDYLVIDPDGVARKWDVSNTFTTNFSTLGTDAMWLNRESRFYATIVYDKAILDYPNGPFVMRQAAQEGVADGYWNYMTKYPGTDGRGVSGYFFRKHRYEGDQCKWNPVGWNPPTNVHWILFRYPEILLNYAEALIYSNRSGDALAPINKVRHRAGLPDLTSPANITADYKREKRVEFALEGFRYWDMLRWAKNDNKTSIPEFNVCPHSMWIAWDRKSYKLERPSNQTPGLYTRSFELPKRFTFPIPLEELKKNPNLSQNQGWE